MNNNTISAIPQHVNEININVRNKKYYFLISFIQEQEKENSNIIKDYNDSGLLNYKINKYNNSNNKNQKYNYLYRSNDNINSLSVFHRMKKDYNEFNPNPDVEEIPTFTFENDKNLNNYKGNIYNKKALIEQNSKNYINYMTRFERKKTPLRTPYAVYKEITSNNLNKYNYNQDNSINKINTNLNNDKNINSNENNSNKNENSLNNNNNQSQKAEWNENFSNNYLHNQSIDKLREGKPLSTSFSAKSFLFDNRKSEITNPDLFYKRNNNDYYKYRAEQKKYLDYNYQILMNKNKLHDKQEPNINPYNPKKEYFEHYKSNLAHNPILNPVNYYSYNKYLEKEIKGGNNNINYNYNINENNRNYTPFQNVGNQIFK